MYQYSLKVLVCTLINYSTFIVIGLVLEMFYENFAMLIPFSIIRQFSGGYHADKYRNCFWGSIIIDVISLLIIKSFTGSSIYWFSGIAITAFILIFFFSPVEHKNKKLNKKEKKYLNLFQLFLVVYG